MLGIDRVANPGDVDLLGQLSAVGIETGKLVINVIDKDAPTIGDAAIVVVADGTDSDGMSIVVKTKAADKNSKVFVTPKDVTDQPLAVTDIKDGESFTVKVKNPVTDDLHFDWWIVEAK